MSQQKEIILEFIRKNREKKYNAKALSKEINISYPTVLKWIDVLYAEKKIKIEDYGNLKLIYFLEEQNGWSRFMGKNKN